MLIRCVVPPHGSWMGRERMCQSQKNVPSYLQLTLHVRTAAHANNVGTLPRHCQWWWWFVSCSCSTSWLMVGQERKQSVSPSFPMTWMTNTLSSLLLDEKSVGCGWVFIMIICHWHLLTLLLLLHHFRHWTIVQDDELSFRRSTTHSSGWYGSIWWYRCYLTKRTIHHSKKTTHETSDELLCVGQPWYYTTICMGQGGQRQCPPERGHSRSGGSGKGAGTSESASSYGITSTCSGGITSASSGRNSNGSSYPDTNSST